MIDPRLVEAYLRRLAKPPPYHAAGGAECRACRCVRKFRRPLQLGLCPVCRGREIDRRTVFARAKHAMRGVHGITHPTTCEIKINTLTWHHELSRQLGGDAEQRRRIRILVRALAERLNALEYDAP